SSRRCRRAFCAVTEATPNSAVSWTSDGTRVSGGYVPSAIRARSTSTICCHLGELSANSITYLTVALDSASRDVHECVHLCSALPRAMATLRAVKTPATG